MSSPKYILTIAYLSLLSCAFTAQAQVVYKTDFKKEANVKIYVTNYQQEADVIVFKTPFIHNAEGNNGIWYFTQFEGEAGKIISFTPSKQAADLIVFYTNKRENAGWVNKKKRFLMR